MNARLAGDDANTFCQLCCVLQRDAVVGRQTQAGTKAGIQLCSELHTAEGAVMYGVWYGSSPEAGVRLWVGHSGIILRRLHGTF